MRKRRVGVTARSRQNDGNQATGTLQFVTEMAAPLELRTPAGTCGGSCKPSADGSMASKAREVNGQKNDPRSVSQGKEMERGSGALRALEALPQTPPGGKPPETPAPFPWALILQNGVNPSRVRKPRRSGAPLTDRLRPEERAGMRERGPCGQGQARAPTGGRDGALRAHEALPHAPPGGKPPETPDFPLDTGWPSHGSRDR
jgi:hypothetical protein